MLYKRGRVVHNKKKTPEEIEEEYLRWYRINQVMVVNDTLRGFQLAKTEMGEKGRGGYSILILQKSSNGYLGFLHDHCEKGGSHQVYNEVKLGNEVILDKGLRLAVNTQDSVQILNPGEYKLETIVLEWRAFVEGEKTNTGEWGYIGGEEGVRNKWVYGRKWMFTSSRMENGNGRK